MRIKTKHIVCLVFIIGISCIDPIKIEVPSEEDPIPVVDANLSSIYSQIRLSWSKGFSNERNPPIMGAEVFVSSNTGDTLFYRESSEGSYENRVLVSDFFVRGQVYNLQVTLPDGRIIVSDDQVYGGITKTGSVPNFRIKTKTRVRPYDDKIVSEPGLEIFMETAPISNNNKLYFRYVVRAEWLMITPYPNNPRGNYCIISDYPLTLLSLGIQKPETNNNTIAFMPADFKMDNGVSFIIEEYIINQPTYEYWKGVKEQIDYQGTPFETPPVNTKNNLQFKSGEDEVLGFFSVESRVNHFYFVPKSDIPEHETLRELCGIGSLLRICSDCSEWRERRQSLFIYNARPERWPG